MEVTQIERALTIVSLFAIVQTRGLLRVKPYTTVSLVITAIMLRNIDDRTVLRFYPAFSSFLLLLSHLFKADFCKLAQRSSVSQGCQRADEAAPAGHTHALRARGIT